MDIPGERTMPRGGSSRNSVSYPETDFEQARTYPVEESPIEGGVPPSGYPEDELNRFQTRLRKGRVKLCFECGGVMTRSTRMVLSPVAGLILILLGAALMAAYGLALNFFQTPWFVEFALPAAYYVGSLFVGVGILFFFVRERIWKCGKCRLIHKR